MNKFWLFFLLACPTEDKTQVDTYAENGCVEYLSPNVDNCFRIPESDIDYKEDWPYSISCDYQFASQDVKWLFCYEDWESDLKDAFDEDNYLIVLDTDTHLQLPAGEGDWDCIGDTCWWKIVCPEGRGQLLLYSRNEWTAHFRVEVRDED